MKTDQTPAPTSKNEISPVIQKADAFISPSASETALS
jgi:hypothetical protein